MAIDTDGTSSSNGDSSTQASVDDSASAGASSSSNGTSSDGASSSSSSDSSSSDSSASSSSDSIANYNVSATIVIGSVDPPAGAASTATATDSSTQTAVAADSSGGSGGGGTVTELINLGLAVWKVMDDGTPNMVPIDQMASGVPSGVSALSQMSNFSTTDQKLQLSYVVNTIGSDNLPGFSPTNLSIVVLWRYGGQYQGVGHYVSNANVSVSGEPGTLRHVDITATFAQPINVGSMNDPVCDLGLNIVVSNHGPFGSDQFVTNYRASLKGDGSGRIDQI